MHTQLGGRVGGAAVVGVVVAGRAASASSSSTVRAQQDGADDERDGDERPPPIALGRVTSARELLHRLVQALELEDEVVDVVGEAVGVAGADADLGRPGDSSSSRACVRRSRSAVDADSAFRRSALASWRSTDAIGAVRFSVGASAALALQRRQPRAQAGRVEAPDRGVDLVAPLGDRPPLGEPAVEAVGDAPQAVVQRARRRRRTVSAEPSAATAAPSWTICRHGSLTVNGSTAASRGARGIASSDRRRRTRRRRCTTAADDRQAEQPGDDAGGRAEQDPPREDRLGRGRRPEAVAEGHGAKI